jgi:hypothetical protein
MSRDCKLPSLFDLGLNIQHLSKLDSDKLYIARYDFHFGASNKSHILTLQASLQGMRASTTHGSRNSQW